MKKLKKKYSKNELSTGIIGKIEAEGIRVFPRPGTAEVSDAYANNERYCRELRICLEVPDWYKFSQQPFFQDLVDYLEKEGILKNKEPLLWEKGLM